MCRMTRQSDDPLLRQFLDVYGLHLLQRPRAGLDVGALVLSREDGSALLDRIDDMLDGPVQLPSVQRDVPMASVQGVLSGSLDLETGAGISEAFLGALGGVGIGAKLRGAFRKMRQTGMRFRFTDAVEDRVNFARLGGALRRRRFDLVHPAYDPEARYYAVTGVARSRSIEIRIEYEAGHGPEAVIGIDGLVDVDAKITAKKTDEATWHFEGEHPVAFGLELFELKLDPKSRRMSIALADHTVNVRGEGGKDIEGDVKVGPGRIGPEDGSPFLAI